MDDPSHPFLCSCFRLDDRQVRTHSADWDWEQLIAEASAEGLLPALYGRMRELGVTESLPQPVGDFLCSVESLNAERNRAIMAEVKVAVRLLHEINIEPVLLKGVAYLSTGVYANPAARYLADVDLLIPEVQIAPAARVLMQNGFELQEADPFARFRHHHPPLLRPNAVHFELHHALTMSKRDSVLSARDLIQSSVSADLDGLAVRVPSPTQMMVHLIMHSQLQHPYNERVWPPIRAMYDLVLLQRRFGSQIQWDLIELWFRSAGRYRTLALHLWQLQDSMGFPTPLPLKWTAELRIAWRRRKILRRFPHLRYLDPVYMFSITVGRRWPIVAKILRTSGGLSYLGAEFLKPHIYRRLVEDMRKGRGL